MFSPQKIKDVSLKYIVKLLTNKKPANGYEEQFKVKERLHKQRMDQTLVNDYETFSFEIFQKVLKHISTKPGINIDLLSRRDSLY